MSPASLVRHVIDWDHVPMWHQHEHWEVDHLWVQFEVTSDALVQDDIPTFRSWLFLTRAVVDAVAPEMAGLSNFILERSRVWMLVNCMRVQHELEVELVKVCFNVDALLFRVHILTDKHEVRVDFKSAIFANNNANLVAFASWLVNFRYRSILKQWWHG